MQERRESDRTGLTLQVGLIQKETNQQIELLRPTINSGGLGGYTRDPVEAGWEVSIRISFPQRSGGMAVEEISGKVVWAHRDGNFNAFGAAFSVIDAARNPQLASYLRYLDQFE
ncbi:MAG: PilZ domain-containing protein [Nitrospiria bacterium]